jgi:hypothetical protein
MGSQAAACLYNPVTVIGGPTYKTEAERERAEEKARLDGWRERIRGRRAAAEEAWRRGVDAPAELAEMLVPNVRPVPIGNSDCGPTNEVDFGAGEETFEDVLAGTDILAEAKGSAAIQREFGVAISFGRSCNTEFRGRFAMHLRRRLGSEDLRRAYLFLAARSRIPERAVAWQPLRRLMAFEGNSRLPPVRWVTEDWLQEKDIARWSTGTRTGRALGRAIDAFWREQAGALADTRQVCPKALEAWPAVQAPFAAAVADYVAARRRRREAARNR